MAYEWIVDALESTWHAIDRLLAPREPADFDRATPCPGWSVRDIVSHLIGFELMIAGEPLPDIDFHMPEHVRNPIGEINERFVQSRRSTLSAELLDEFRTVTAHSLTRLRSLDDETWDQVGWSPEGDVPMHRFQETRILDSWIHLQDLRDALLEPEDDHGEGEEIVINRFEAAMPYVIGRRAGAPDGSTVRINLVGRLARTITIEVDGTRARAVPALSGEPTVEITTPVALFWRRAAGRISAGAFLGASATDVRGDRELARRIVDGFVVMI